MAALVCRKYSGVATFSESNSRRAARLRERLEPEVRRQFLEVDQRRPVIEILRIPARRAVHRRGRQLGLEREHGIGVGLRCLGGIAEELEHLGRILDELLPPLDGLRIGLQVVVAIGQAQPALVDLGDHPTRVVRVGSRTEGEERRNAARVQLGDHVEQARLVLHRIHPLQIRRDRRRAPRLDRRLVHAGRIVVADLLLERAVRHTRLPGVLEDRGEPLLVVLAHLVVAPEPRLVGRQRVARAPAAAGELVEVHTRVGSAIELREIEAAVLGLLRPCGGAAEGEDEEGLLHGISRQD